MRKLTRVIFFVVFIFVSLLFYVWQRTQNMRLGYEVSMLRSECEAISQENVNLQLQISSHLSMEKLDQVARKKHLSVPTEDRIIYVKEK